MATKRYSTTVRAIFVLAFLSLLIGKTPIENAQADAAGWSNDWQFPIPGAPVTAGWCADNSAYGAEGCHSGIDLGTGGMNYPMVLASNDGIVTLVEDRGVQLQGLTVCVFHGWDATGQPVTTVYGHNQNAQVAVGDVVRKGQPIVQAYGFWPPNGVVFQPHLHFMYEVAEQCSYTRSIMRDPMTLTTIATWWDGRPADQPLSEAVAPSVPQPAQLPITVSNEPMNYSELDEMIPFNTSAPVQQAQTVSFEQLPFVVDRRAEAADIMPRVYADDRPTTTDIVVHEAWLAALCNTTPDYAMAVDGPRLVAGWKAKNGWDKPGYAVVVRWTDQGDYAPTDWIANLSTRTYGVGVDGVNEKSIHVAFVGYPCDSDMTAPQRNSMIAVVRALMTAFGVPIENVKAHKEWGGHRDPSAVNMDEFRAQVSNGYLLPVNGTISPMEGAAVDIPIDWLDVEPEADMAIPFGVTPEVVAPISQWTNPGNPDWLAIVVALCGVLMIVRKKRMLGVLIIVLAIVMWLGGSNG